MSHGFQGDDYYPLFEEHDNDVNSLDLDYNPRMGHSQGGSHFVSLLSIS